MGVGRREGVTENTATVCLDPVSKLTADVTSLFCVRACVFCVLVAAYISG